MSSRQTEPTPASKGKESKGTKRKRAILEAAERAFGREGYWSATTAEIARAAGVTQPALYRYFPNKQSLFLETLALRQADIIEAIRAALAQPGTSRQRIENIGAATLAIAKRYPDMARLRLQAIAVAGQDPVVRKVVVATIDQLLAAHRGLIDAAKAEGSLPAHVDSEVLAATLSAFATQLYVALVLEHPLEQVADRALPSLLEMIDSAQATPPEEG